MRDVAYKGETEPFGIDETRTEVLEDSGFRPEEDTRVARQANGRGFTPAEMGPILRDGEAVAVTGVGGVVVQKLAPLEGGDGVVDEVAGDGFAAGAGVLLLDALLFLELCEGDVGGDSFAKALSRGAARCEKGDWNSVGE